MLNKVIRMAKPLRAYERKMLSHKLLKMGMSKAEVDKHINDLENAVLGAHEKEKKRVNSSKRKAHNRDSLKILGRHNVRAEETMPLLS